MGQFLSSVSQNLSELSPPDPKWTEDDIPSLEGKVIIVTGGNTGIGKRTCEVLYGKGAKVYLAARDPSKGQAAIDEITSSSNTKERKGSIHYLKLDLSSLPAIKQAANEFKGKEERLDVLFNSAGVMFPPKDWLNDAGLDLQFATNVLGHFALTHHLLPLLESTASSPGTPKGSVRVVTTSSSGHQFAPSKGIDLSDPKLQLGGGASTTTLYGQSKLGNILFSNELSRRYADKGIISFSLNPGNIKTDLARHTPSFFQFLIKPFVHPVRLGALTQLWLGTAGSDKEGGGDGVTVDKSGSYGIPWARFGMTGHSKAKDEELAKNLWEWCEGQVEAGERDGNGDVNGNQ